MSVIVAVVTVVDDQVDKTNAPVGLAVPPPWLGDDESPGDVSLLTLGQRHQRGLGVAEEEVSGPMTQGWVSGAVQSEQIRHLHCLLPAALTEIIRNIGLCSGQKMSIRVGNKCQ